MKKILVVLLTCMLGYGCMYRTSYNMVKPANAFKSITPAPAAPPVKDVVEGPELHPLIFVSILLN